MNFQETQISKKMSLGGAIFDCYTILISRPIGFRWELANTINNYDSFSISVWICDGGLLSLSPPPSLPSVCAYLHRAHKHQCIHEYFLLNIDVHINNKHRSWMVIWKRVLQREQSQLFPRWWSQRFVFVGEANAGRAHSHTEISPHECICP